MGGRGSGGHNRRNPSRPIANDRPLWDRQPDETDKAWGAFVVYRGMGARRAIRKAVDELGQKKTYQSILEKWSVKWSWRKRVEAWDREVDRVVRKAELDAVEKMRKRHIQLGLLKQTLGARELQKHDKASMEKADKATLEVDEASRLIKDGIGIERLNRGEPESVHEVRGRMTWADLMRSAEEDE